MYIAAFLLFGCSVAVLAMGLTECFKYNSRTKKELRKLWEVRDEPMLCSDLDDGDMSAASPETVDSQYHQNHRDVVNELRRDFRIVNYTENKIPKVIRSQVISQN